MIVDDYISIKTLQHREDGFHKGIQGVRQVGEIIMISPIIYGIILGILHQITWFWDLETKWRKTGNGKMK